MHIDF